METLGVDANGGLNYSLFAQSNRKFAVRYHRNDGFILPNGQPANLTPEEAIDARNHDVKLVSVWQNGVTQEVWEGYNQGRFCANEARQQQSACGGTGKPIYFAVDKRTSLNGNYPIGPVIQFFRGVKSVIGYDRVGVYGTSFTLQKLKEEGNLVKFFWQTWLWDGIYDDPPKPKSPVLPYTHFLQYENADRTGKSHYGADGISYVAYDKAFKEYWGQWTSQI